MSYFFSNSSDRTLNLLFSAFRLHYFKVGAVDTPRGTTTKCAFKRLVSEWKETMNCLNMAESDTEVNHDSQEWQGRNAKIGRQLEEGGISEGFTEKVLFELGQKGFVCLENSRTVPESLQAGGRGQRWPNTGHLYTFLMEKTDLA